LTCSTHNAILYVSKPISTNIHIGLKIGGRPMKEKGIEDAIQIVTYINNYYGKTVYTLDIYGSIDSDYQKRFNHLMNNSSDYILYGGIIDYSKTVEVLKDYYAMMFLTYYKTEGTPGSIIDAYSAGLPVISYNWNSAGEVIKQNKTGFIFETGDTKSIEDFLIDLYHESDVINPMKINCLEESKLYKPELVIKKLSKYLEGDINNGNKFL